MGQLKKSVIVLAVVSALFFGVATVQAKDFYKMGTLQPGTSPYLTMSTMATIINQNMESVEIQINATCAATKHAIDAGRGKLDIHMTSPVIHEFLIQGKAMYSKIKDHKEIADDARLMFWFPIGVYHITVYEDSGIKTLADIKGKKVFLGPPGGGATNSMRAWVKATTGYEPGKDFSTVKLGWAAAAQAFQDRQMDVYINPTNAPSPINEQMIITSKLRFLGVSEAQRNEKQIKAQFSRPGRFLGIIPAGTYGKNQANKSDVHTLGAIVGVAVSKRIPEANMYQMTKVFWEGVKKMEGQAPWLRNISLETAVMEGPLPLHPGAAKYYKEIGLSIPARNLLPAN